MRWISVVLVAALVACSHEDGAEEFQRSLDSAGTEMDRHLEACTAASSDTGMRREMDRHQEAIQSLLDEMGDHFDMMEHCYRSDPGAMKNLMSDLRREEGVHRDRIDEAATLDEARTECKRFDAVANDELDRMHRLLLSDGSHCMMM